MTDGGAASAQASVAVAELETDMKDFLQQLDAALQEDPNLDRETRDALLRQLEDTMGESGTNAAALATIPDRAVWMDAMQALQSSGAIDESEANDLIRQINQALQPLQRRESQLAIEFSRRLQIEGEEKALAWFRREAAVLANDAEAEHAPPPPVEVSPIRSEVVNSRSRRLRGPPDGR
jgi:hypothetical protein